MMSLLQEMQDEFNRHYKNRRDIRIRHGEKDQKLRETAANDLAEFFDTQDVPEEVHAIHVIVWADSYSMNLLFSIIPKTELTKEFLSKNHAELFDATEDDVIQGLDSDEINVGKAFEIDDVASEVMSQAIGDDKCSLILDSLDGFHEAFENIFNGHYNICLTRTDGKWSSKVRNIKRF